MAAVSHSKVLNTLLFFVSHYYTKIVHKNTINLEITKTFQGKML